VNLSPLQERVLGAITRWLADPSGKQTFYLAGVAGSGKSSLIARAVGNLDGVLYMAPTGKAALIMRRKGCPDARTIHQTIYRPAGSGLGPRQRENLRARCAQLRATGNPRDLVLVERLEEQLRRSEDPKLSGPRFSLNEESDLRRAKLGVIDEASMVDRTVGRDLESFGTRLLVIGDEAQLPPVYGAGYFTSREPDAVLDEVHRQALDSPILRLADLARRGSRLPVGPAGDGVDVLRFGDASLEARARAADMILVGKNATRHGTNERLRQLLGRSDKMPVAGDRVICRRNDHDLGLLNGSSWTVECSVVEQDRGTVRLQVRSHDDDARVECAAWMHHFEGREGQLGANRRDFAEFAYGWAQTVHTAQGSQWDSVYVRDQSACFGRDACRHLYTAITRAVKALTVVVG